MRRLTLILSDLYLPADAVRESFPTTLPLPALQSLLRFASPPARIRDWRWWLAREVGAGSMSEWPVAHVCALGAGRPMEGAWLATPVALEARLDHVRLRDRGLLRLSPDEQRSLQAEFTQVFGGSVALEAGSHSSPILEGGPRADVVTRDPARLLDSDIGQALPSGPAASELRRLGAEIEMWLHASRLNEAREKTGRPRIASLWLWGGGAMPATTRADAHPAQNYRIHGNDNFVAALRVILGAASSSPGPRGLADLALDAPAFVQLAPMSGSDDESLSALDANWFEPALVALRVGALDALRIVANDRVFEVSRRARFKFWRRQRGWLESLA